MFRQSRMNQSRLPQRTTAVYSQGDRQHQSLATPAPYILPSDICEPHTQIQTHTQRNISHLTLPCHTLPIAHPLHHYVSQGFVLAPLTLVFATFFERIHMERHSCQLSKNLSFLISQKGIMRLITYIVIEVNALDRTWLTTLPGDKGWLGTLGHLR